MTLVNHYSFVFAVGFLIFWLTIVLIRKGFNRKTVLLLGILITGVIVTWYLVRPTQNIDVNPDQSANLIGNGIPVLLEYQSPY